MRFHNQSIIIISRRKTGIIFMIIIFKTRQTDRLFYQQIVFAAD